MTTQDPLDEGDEDEEAFFTEMEIYRFCVVLLMLVVMGFGAYYAYSIVVKGKTVSDDNRCGHLAVENFSFFILLYITTQVTQIGSNLVHTWFTNKILAS